MKPIAYGIKSDMQQCLFSLFYMGETTRIGKNCFNKRKRIVLNYYTMWLEFILQFKIKILLSIVHDSLQRKMPKY